MKMRARLIAYGLRRVRATARTRYASAAAISGLRASRLRHRRARPPRARHLHCGTHTRLPTGRAPHLRAPRGRNYIWGVLFPATAAEVRPFRTRARRASNSAALIKLSSRRLASPNNFSLVALGGREPRSSRIARLRSRVVLPDLTTPSRAPPPRDVGDIPVQPRCCAMVLPVALPGLSHERCTSYGPPGHMVK